MLALGSEDFAYQSARQRTCALISFEDDVYFSANLNALPRASRDCRGLGTSLGGEGLPRLGRERDELRPGESRPPTTTMVTVTVTVMVIAINADGGPMPP